MSPDARHPRTVLLGAQAAAYALPVCDHYSGVEARMRKSLALQAALLQEFGACVVDVTLDLEDGAPVGAEREQAALVAELANGAVDLAATGERARVGVRVHPVDHAAFGDDVATVLGRAASALSYVMVPKVESRTDVERAVDTIDAACSLGVPPLPLHVLVESPAAVQQAFAIAAHPRVESVSFGLMDFVSAHGGAIGASAMGLRAATDTTTLDQFHHPLVVRAKLEVASACHAHGKVPSHCVVTEFRDAAALQRAARLAAQAFGYTRMWSIHPDQIRPIIEALSPSRATIDEASEIVLAAQAQEWAPISVRGTLHDRASYRYYWRILERAHQTGCALPAPVQSFFGSGGH